MIRSYPKVYNLGHAAIRDLLTGDVVIQEKVDGSQISFGVIDGELEVKSKNNQIDLDAPQKMFQDAARVARHLEPRLHPGWIYRGEYLNRPKHNVLAYDRTPKDHIILFDVEVGEQDFMSPEELTKEADRIGLECVPTLHRGGCDRFESPDALRELLDNVSCLGGQQIEGIVIKRYGYFGRDGKTLMGKHVSEKFKEVHQKEWKKDNPTRQDVLEVLMSRYRSEPRWEKAYQHLRDDGLLERSPKDIGTLIKAVHRDIDEECSDEIKQKLYDWAFPKIIRRSTMGLAEWYKAKLFDQQFAEKEAA